MGHVQIKNLYINGCSWTDGDTLDVNGLIKTCNIPGKGRNYSYPTLVANHFNLKLQDDSRYGGSINRIVRMCWEYIMTNNISNTTFILEIPNGFRDEIYSNKIGRYFNITGGLLSNPNDLTEDNAEWHDIKKDVINSYYNFCNFEEFGKKEYVNLMSLISYIKQHTNNIYLLQPYDIINKYNIYKGIVTDRNIIKLSDSTFNCKEYSFIQDMCKNEKLSLGDELNNGIEDTHPGISGHKKISEIIVKHLIKYESNII
jgi:hypothetical protein